jgi:hypothetical protein
LFASLQDQPERRKATYIMLGRSSYTAQWGLALDFAAATSGIPCCKLCTEKNIRDYTSNDAKCTQCAKWDTQVNNGLLDFLPPNNYPSDLLPPSKKLSPKRITYETMMDAVGTAHDGLVNNNWKVATLTDYLRVNGLNDEAVQSMKKCTIKCKNYKDVKQIHSEDAPSPEFLELEKERENKPELYAMWSFSATWQRGVPFDQHIDIIMHLLFMGLIKTIMQNIQEWMMKRTK